MKFTLKRPTGTVGHPHGILHPDTATQEEIAALYNKSEAGRRTVERLYTITSDAKKHVKVTHKPEESDPASDTAEAVE